MLEKSKYTIEYFINGILKKDRIVLSKAITLVESTKEEDKIIARELIQFCLGTKNKSKRIAITGMPGAGKSTFINSLGRILLDKGNTLAVLAVDPSSSISKGSILGDKTRMDEIVNDAYVRPTASSNNLGGVSRKTRESILLCEAFGFDYIFIETVGIGQSEIEVKNMTDLFLLLLIPNAGDELQGIKRGVMEMADIVVINKADKENIIAAKTAAAQVQLALHLYQENEKKWTTPVLPVSSLERTGMEKLEASIDSYFLKTETNGFLEKNRTEQQIHWFNEMIRIGMMEKIEKNSVIQSYKTELENKITLKEIDVNLAADLLIQKLIK